MPSRSLTAIYAFPAFNSGFVHPRPAAGLGELASPLKISLLYGSLPKRSCSRLCVEEAACLLHFLDAKIKVCDPRDLLLPIQVVDPDHPGLYELHQLPCIRRARMVQPERHGQMTGVMKAQRVHFQLTMVGIRPTQGQILAVMQVSAGFQPFRNAANFWGARCA